MINPKNWRSPRRSISTSYFENDYGYVLHAAMKFMEFLFITRMSVDALRGKRILDYGCGTGVMARILALTGAHVVGYDPTSECIAQGLVIEKKKAPPTSLTPKLLTSDLEKIGDNFDIVVCISVLPHLTRADQDLAIKNIINSLKEGGVCYLWVHKHTHLPLIDKDEIRNLETNIIIIKGIKENGKIEYYEK